MVTRVFVEKKQGFNIEARQMAALADGAIVGSAIVKKMAAHGRGAPADVGAYVKAMKAAVGQGAPQGKA